MRNSKMKYAKEEQETFIHFDPDTKNWHYETMYAPHIKQISSLIKKTPTAFVNIKKEVDDDGTIVSISCDAANTSDVPMTSSNFTKMLPKQKRQLSEEQRLALKAQLDKGRQTQSENKPK